MRVANQADWPLESDAARGLIGGGSAMIEARTGRDGARVYRARVYRGRYLASRTFARKRDAQEWERRQVDGLRSGVWSDPGAAERPVQDWCDAWLASQSPRAPATERKIREAINKRIAKPSAGVRRYPFDRLRSGPGARIWHEHSPLPLRVTRWASYAEFSITPCRTGPFPGIPRRVSAYRRSKEMSHSRSRTLNSGSSQSNSMPGETGS
jgi:hypothetical protein